MASNIDNSKRDGTNTSKRGFASMDQDKQREIASKGGQAAHERGTAHQFDSEEAREAGRKGSEAVSADRGHMADIGRKGGEQSHRSASSAANSDNRNETRVSGGLPGSREGSGDSRNETRSGGMQNDREGSSSASNRDDTRRDDSRSDSQVREDDSRGKTRGVGGEQQVEAWRQGNDKNN